MDIVEAIRRRKSIRKFTSDPIPKDVLKDILETAQWAPSAENTQPWAFYVLAGDVLDTIRKENIEKLQAMTLPPEEMAHILVDRPRGSIYRKRQVDIAKQLFRLMDIPREDRDKRAAWMERGFRYFDAPVAIVIVADRSLPIHGTYLDVGAVMQNICLAALHHGLATCIENQGITYADVVRKHANIPEEKRLMAAIAIGYPDWDFPANHVQSERESIDRVVTWCGI